MSPSLLHCILDHDAKRLHGEESYRASLGKRDAGRHLSANMHQSGQGEGK